jgi:hypothetical protein
MLRRLLIIVPVVLALILTSLLMPARQVTIKGIGTLSFETAVTLSIGQQAAYASPGWLSGWTYRRPISLSPVTPAADYQVLVTLTTGIMGNPYTNVKADGSDIRFTGSDETTPQDYWIESWNNAGTSKIWVEVKTSGTSKIYMYYGNSGATSASNGDATFDFFDDFSGTLSKWTIDPENTDNKVYIYNGALRHDPDSTQSKNVYYDTRIRTTDYKILDGVIEYSVYLAGSTSSSPRIIHQLGFRVQSLNFENGYCWRLQNSYFDGGHLEFTGIPSSPWTPFGTAYPATTGNVWHTVKEVVSGSTYTGYVDGGSGYSGSDSTKLTADYLVSHVHGVSLDGSSYVLVDNVRVRKYAATEPIATVGSEEPAISNTPGIIAFGSVSENSPYWSSGSAPNWADGLNDGECFFNVTNNSSAPINISIKATNFTGGGGWTLASSPGLKQVVLKAGKSGDTIEDDMVILETSDKSFITGLGASQSKRWELKLETGTFTDGVPKSSTITLTATIP